MPAASGSARGPTRRAALAGCAGLALAAAGYGGWRLTRPGFEGQEMTPGEARDAVAAGSIVLVDIRRPDEWAATGLPAGAVAIDMRQDDFAGAVASALGGDRTRPVALICAAGVRSDRASLAMAEAGFTNVIDVPEGMLGSSAGPGWLARDLPVEMVASR